jgi:hypothetical protein
MFDPTTTAKVFVDFLMPALPFLVKIGEDVASDAVKKIGHDAWNKAVFLWSKLQSKMIDNASLRQSVEDAADNLTDSDAQAALRLQIKKLLTSDSQFLAEIGAQLQREASGNTVTANDRSVAAGGDITGNTIISGDKNNLRFR